MFQDSHSLNPPIGPSNPAQPDRSQPQPLQILLIGTRPQIHHTIHLLHTHNILPAPLWSKPIPHPHGHPGQWLATARKPTP
ncbi:hypothetical protein [Prochlorothrix hollandica]|uniref:hypothetical protein n=1 Tax=Prochlorothrix hollandica TaxID=1223 RepID=UPI00034C77BB|nr:hypothetical protein [Prochlorothrix hollandica]